MNTDNWQTLLDEADALNHNARLLRLFELEPVVAAAADSAQKQRALARIYEALSRYQSAFTHFQAVADRSGEEDRHTFARLKQMAANYGDRFAAKRPLRITAELKATLPQFKYCLDPLATNIFKTQEEAVTCDCCGKATQIFYNSPFYSQATINALCPDCVASGSAAAKFAGEFVDSGSISRDIAEERRDELCQRTPSYAGWQQEEWPDHCDDYCAFIGYTGWQELQTQGIADNIVWHNDRPDPEYLQYIAADGSLVGYLFRCLHCGQHVLHIDSD